MVNKKEREDRNKEIIALRAAKPPISYRKIAKRYGIDHSTVIKIIQKSGGESYAQGAVK